MCFRLARGKGSELTGAGSEAVSSSPRWRTGDVHCSVPDFSRTVLRRAGAILVLATGVAPGHQRFRRWGNSRCHVSFASLLGQGNHEQTLVGDWQGMPDIRLVLEHNLIVLIVNHHLILPHFFDWIERHTLVSFFFNDMKVNCLATQKTSCDGLCNFIRRRCRAAVSKEETTL